MTKIKKKAIRAHEKYLEPHRKNPKVVNKIDRMMIAIGLLGSLATIIQVIHIYLTRNVGGISIYSWMLYLCVTISWLLYGVFHRTKPLIMINTLALFTHASIISGYFLYK